MKLRGKKPGSPKTGGRVKGSVNKITAEQRVRADRVLQIIESTSLEEDIRKLSPYNRMCLYRDVLKYRQPKLSQ